METLDGYQLSEGEECWVTVQDPMGEHKLSPAARKAYYRDENAKQHGWEFTVKGIRVPDLEVEIVGIWKYNPNSPTPKNTGDKDE